MKRMAGVLVALALATGLAAEEKPTGYWGSQKSAWERLGPGQKDEVFRFAEGYKSYLTVSRSALTSTREILRLAKAAGFAELEEDSRVKPGARLFVNGRDRAVILVVVGSEPIVSGSRVIEPSSPSFTLRSPILRWKLLR